MYAFKNILNAIALATTAYAQGACVHTESCNKAAVVLTGKADFGITNGFCMAFYNGQDCFDIGCGPTKLKVTGTLVDDGTANMVVSYGTCHADFQTNVITGCAAGAHFETSAPINC